MMKLGTTVLVVDSVEKAVKFYTEKLAFDIVEMLPNKEEGNRTLSYANIRKGKCFIIFRTPHVEEMAEFSFIKRCTSRCVGIYIEMKKGLEKYFVRCNKKEVQILEELKDQPWGHKTFSIRDPFGVKLTFAQAIEGFVEKAENFAGLSVSKTDASGQAKTNEQLQEEMIKYLKGFGILRRAAKKYSKLWLKKFK